ncbi:MAG: hypothetical protein ACRD4E_10585 [Bryobacteraceae bacterium]
MKLARFLPALLAIPLCAQSSPQYGTRMGQIQSEYLEGPLGTQAIIQERIREDLAERTREIERGRLTTATPVIVIQNGAAVVPPPPRDKGPRVDFETWVEQPTRDFAESVVAKDADFEREAGKATIHRVVRDNFRDISLAYTVTVETIPSTETFRVVFSDSAVPHPVPQVLRDGETIALTLMNDARTGRRVVDYIRVSTDLVRPRKGAARDIYADDAELAITQPHLRTNGVEQKADGASGTMSAPVVWVDIPGQGRYDLSFKPRADQGFERAGEVAENSLVFSLGGNIFRIDCADRIATGSGTYNIYARKDPEAPADPARVAFGAKR